MILGRRESNDSFKVGDLVQTVKETKASPPGWIGIVLGVHATGVVRVMFNELAWTAKPCDVWADPNLIRKMNHD